jgi:CheY-like chemotaxis protein
VIGAKKLTQTDDAVTIEFSVKDSGIGVPADKQDVIFDEFAQADASTTRKYGGTGLGLSICKKIVALMGGKIWVESEPGKGCTFYFSIPFRLQPEKSRETGPDHTNLKDVPVLIVDDNATNRYILKTILNRLGMIADEAASGKAALEQLAQSQRKYAFILLDVQMPEMDGFEFAEALRKNRQYDDVKIVIVSSEGQRGDANYCKRLGISAYLLKPVDHVHLAYAIREILSGRVVPGKLITRHTLAESQVKLNILLAEDDAVNQKLTVKMLEKRGWNVKATTNGKEALEVLKKEHFDIILMDIQMPVMDGYEAAKAFRQQESGEHTPMIALTAHAFEEEKQKCLDSGMDDVITKPIRARQFYETIEKHAKKTASNLT